MVKARPDTGRVRVQVRILAFPGTSGEREALRAAVSRHCAASDGDPADTEPGPHACAAHDLLLAETTLSRLVFYRRWGRSLLRGEWLRDPDWTGRDPKPR